MKRRKRTISEYFAEKSGFPETVLASTPDIHILGTREMICEGCRGILVYEETEIRIRLRDRIMAVTGCNLTLSTFYQNHVSIAGRIEGINFFEEEM